MTDILRTGAAWLRDRLKAGAATTVVYAREPTNSVSIPATIGRTAFRQNANTGRSQLVFSDRDYLIDPALLILADGLTTPQKGDRITDSDGQFEVLAYNGEPESRDTDATGTLRRIHTKRVYDFNA